MTVTINGTTGITTPAISSDAGITSDGISFADGTPANTLVTTTGGNVGIGTSSPQQQLHLNGGGAFRCSNSANTSGFDVGLLGGGADPAVYMYQRANSFIAIGTNNTERARIDSSGNLLVGATSAAGSEKLNVTTSANATIARFHNDAVSGSVNGLFVRYRNLTPNNTSNQFLYCDDFTALRMEVRSNGGIANYSANNANLSDARTKTDIVDAGSYLAKICAIPVRTFKYKDQTDDLLNLGVIAQEVEAVAPELVDVSGFGETPEDGVPLKAIYQTDLQYALMKCIQELKAELDAAKADIATLKGQA